MSLSGLKKQFLTMEIEDLNRELMTKTDELNAAIKRNSEVCVPYSACKYMCKYWSHTASYRFKLRTPLTSWKTRMSRSMH